MVGRNLQCALRDTLHTVLAPSSRELNLLSLQEVSAYLDEYSPEVVIHCAGKVGGIQANIEDAPGFLYENVQMGLNLLNAAHTSGVQQLLNLGSSCMYPRHATNPLQEDQILTGELEPTNEGYALAKITVAKYAQYLSTKFENRFYKTLIPCNLFGAFDHFHPQKSHLIPAVIRKVHEAVETASQEVVIWGDGTARREFMDARDLASAILFCMEIMETLPTMLNVGLGHDYSVLDYYVTVAEVIGFTGQFKFDTTKPAGMKQKLTDVSRLNHLGWKSQITLEQGIQHAYEYFLSEPTS
jgi:GDP-L-fucose synthase